MKTNCFYAAKISHTNKKKWNKSKKINIDFIVEQDLIYHIKNEDVKRLCISLTCEKTIFEMTHDQNNHANFH